MEPEFAEGATLRLLAARFCSRPLGAWHSSSAVMWRVEAQPEREGNRPSSIARETGSMEAQRENPAPSSSMRPVAPPVVIG